MNFLLLRGLQKANSNPYHLSNLQNDSMWKFGSNYLSVFFAPALELASLNTKKQCKFESKFLFIKNYRNLIYFSTCILLDYVAYDIIKDFWKITLARNKPYLWAYKIFIHGSKYYLFYISGSSKMVVVSSTYNQSSFRPNV